MMRNTMSQSVAELRRSVAFLAVTILTGLRIDRLVSWTARTINAVHNAIESVQARIEDGRRRRGRREPDGPPPPHHPNCRCALPDGDDSGDDIDETLRRVANTWGLECRIVDPVTGEVIDPGTPVDAMLDEISGSDGGDVRWR